MKTFIDVVDYWFENPNDYKKWFLSGTTLDKYISENYKDLLDYHLQTNNGIGLVTKSNLKVILGRIILLDQLARHIYRDTPKAFSGEKYTVPLSLTLLETGLIDKLTMPERIFALMPLQHSENLKDKQLILEYLETIIHNKELNDHQMILSFKQHTINHSEVIKKFGRYPKRNAALSRKNTDEEMEYLNQNKNTHY